jgi:Leucine-rich repeat (LRR) protein
MLCKLTRLDDCEFGPMKESYLRDLSPLSHCTQLKRLDITGGGTMCLTPLSSLSGVQELHISNYVSLAPLSSLNRLGRLYISSKQIQSSYWKEIEELQSLIPCLKVTYG